MKYLLFVLVLALQTQTPSEPYPGQGEHREPPVGWMCHRPEMDRLGHYTPEEETHLCGCERSCDQDTQVVHEDKRCAVYCHPTHCACGMSGAQRCMPEAQR
jgi:hypothetical protein